MKNIRAFFIFALTPLLVGYLVASTQGHKSLLNSTVNFNNNNVLPTDRITITEKGTIFSLTQTGITAIPTNHLELIQAIPIKDTFIGIDKQKNYASLEEFSSTGSLLKTLQDGNTGNIDTMNWFTDPTINANQQKIAFVSDKDKDKTNVLDNALFVENLSNNSIQKIANPNPHSGGIAHPVWNPTNPDSIIYDDYQYDQKDNPYSVINEYNLQTQITNPLTTQKQNAYQGSFSSNGKEFIFLGRNNNITTVMYLADVTTNGLSNVHSIAIGDFAYPKFSYTTNHIYYLKAQGNGGYDLYTAIVTLNKLTNISPVSIGEQLQANSGFTVSNK